MQLVEREFTELYNGDVAAVHTVYLCPEVDRLLAEYSKLESSLLDLLDGYTYTKRRGKTVKRQTVGLLYQADNSCLPAPPAQLFACTP